MDKPIPCKEKDYMANNDSQIIGFELLQYGLPNASFMQLLYDCGGTISIPELKINISLKDKKEPFYDKLIPRLIRKGLLNFGIKAYTDEALFNSIVERVSESTGKKYHFDYQVQIKNKFNASIPTRWYIEVALDTSLISFYRSAIWLNDNNYQGINVKRGITEPQVETFRALLNSPQIDEEAKKWREFAATLKKVGERRAALAAAKRWEGLTLVQIYDEIYPSQIDNDPTTKKPQISKLLRRAKELSEENLSLKMC